MDDTFTLEEVPYILLTIHLRIPNPKSKLDKNQVEEVVEAISEAVTSEIETELINASHTNVLLLRQVMIQFSKQGINTKVPKQVFGQGEKWHLNLETDLSELENR